MPTQLAQNIIEYLDLFYLKNSPCSGDSEGYVSSMEYELEKHFDIDWSLGGTYGTCWDGDEGPREIEPSDEPYMERLQDFLDKYYPKLSYEDTKYIKNSFSEKETSESDWYGGSTSHMYKSLHFDNLADYLIDLVYKGTEYESIEFNDLLQKHSKIVIHLEECNYDKLALHKSLKIDLVNEKETSRISKI